MISSKVGSDVPQTVTAAIGATAMILQSLPGTSNKKWGRNVEYRAFPLTAYKLGLCLQLG